MFTATSAELDIHYDLGSGDHPLIGRRMPDLDIVTADGPLRVYSLMHKALPLLINFGPAGELDSTRWAGRVVRIDAAYTGEWTVPALGPIAAPTAVLIRPDGHVAWAGNPGEPGQPALTEALGTWFGPAAR
jgi:3-(3-hydroxy-phenyl)propionate hydroxylase